MPRWVPGVDWETFLWVEMAASCLFQAFLKGKGGIFQVLILQIGGFKGEERLLALCSCENKVQSFHPYSPARGVTGDLTAESELLVLLNFGIKAK